MKRLLIPLDESIQSVPVSDDSQILKPWTDEERKRFVSSEKRGSGKASACDEQEMSSDRSQGKDVDQGPDEGSVLTRLKRRRMSSLN